MDQDAFFLIFAFTILVVRIGYLIVPIPGPVIAGYRLHHYVYGLILMPISYLVESLTLFAVGLALFIDELTWLLMRGKGHEDNYSWKSLLGTATLSLAVFLLRDYLAAPFL